MPVPEPLPEMELLIKVLRSVLSAEVGLTSEIAEVTSPDRSEQMTAQFNKAVERHRVAQVLAPYAEELGLAPGISAHLQAAARQSMLDAMAGVADTVHVSRTLSEAGIPHLILKGVALAQQTTGSALSRGPGDVDVLIDPAGVADAVGALVASGMRREGSGSPPPDSPLFEATQRVQKEMMLWHGDRQVDLHWRLDKPRASLTWPFVELARSAESVTIGGVTVATLGPMHASVFNACHGATDAWTQLRAIVDHVRLLRDLDEESVMAEADVVGARRRVELANEMTARLMGVTAPGTGRSASAAVNLMWAWILAGEDFKGRLTLKTAVRGFATDLVLYDSSKAAVQRMGALPWPVGAMAMRQLGSAGDRHPGLYVAGTPYFLSKRVLERWRGA